MKTFEEFVKSIIPHIEKRYELYKLCETPDKLIGMKVMAIRAGFGCDSRGGTKMTIVQIDEPRDQFLHPYGVVRDVHLKSNEDTDRYIKENFLDGWICSLHELSDCVVLY